MKAINYYLWGLTNLGRSLADPTYWPYGQWVEEQGIGE